VIRSSRSRQLTRLGPVPLPAPPASPREAFQRCSDSSPWSSAQLHSCFGWCTTADLIESCKLCYGLALSDLLYQLCASFEIKRAAHLVPLSLGGVEVLVFWLVSLAIGTYSIPGSLPAAELTYGLKIWVGVHCLRGPSVTSQRALSIVFVESGRAGKSMARASEG
jgi:hypothetical protein